MTANELMAATLDQLKEFVKSNVRRMAIDAWLTGYALNVAQARIGGKGWKKWLKDNFPELSYQTLNRWQKLAKETPDPNELQGVALKEAYYRAGLMARPNQPQPKTQKLTNEPQRTLVQTLETELQRRADDKQLVNELLALLQWAKKTLQHLQAAGAA